MNIAFRTATEADIPLLREFEQKLINHERSVEPTVKKEVPLTYYDIPKMLTETDKVLMLIAEVDGEPAGCGFARIRPSENCYTYSQHGYLGLIYVEESQRGQNVGGKIIDKLVEWLHEHNINDVILRVYAANVSAVKAYEKYGFAHYVHEMKLRAKK